MYVKSRAIIVQRDYTLLSAERQPQQRQWKQTTNLKPTIGYSLQILHLALCFTVRKNKRDLC